MASLPKYTAAYDASRQSRGVQAIRPAHQAAQKPQTQWAMPQTLSCFHGDKPSSRQMEMASPQQAFDVHQALSQTLIDPYFLSSPLSKVYQETDKQFHLEKMEQAKKQGASGLSTPLISGFDPVGWSKLPGGQWVWIVGAALVAGLYFFVLKPKKAR